MFPVEIWEIILQKIPDPSALMVLQEVCSTWYCIIEKIIKNFNWKRTCMHEIGRSHVHDIMIKAFPSHCLDDYPVIIDEEIWRGTFYSFSKWIMILQAEAVLTKIHVSEKFKENEFITCTAASSKKNLFTYLNKLLPLFFLLLNNISSLIFFFFR